MESKNDHVINVFEFINDKGEKSFAYSQKVDDVGFAYYIITTDEENKPKIIKINNAFKMFSTKKIKPVTVDSEEYIKFINVYAYIQRQKKLNENSEKKLTYTPKK